MKFNWGTGIFIFYTVFALSLVVVVVKSTQYDNSLVTKDYYAKDITYQRTIDAKRNSSLLNQAVDMAITPGNCQLSFPLAEVDGPISGTLHFYRPSSSKYDRIVKLKTDGGGRMLVGTEELHPGYYQAIVEWSAGDKHYYDEFPLVINSPSATSK